MDTIFVFAYYSYKDPVFQSAVFPYLKVTASKGIRFMLLTWEQDRFSMDNDVKMRATEEMESLNIIWRTATWHSGRLKLIAKAYDLLSGVIYSWHLVRKFKARKIYSEGFPGAIIGHLLSKVTKVPHIIHTFEPHADYMLEAGIWTSSSWEYRLLKRFEVPIANHAQHIVTATVGYKQVLLERGVRENIEVIPSCIDTTFYRFLPARRREIRSALGLDDNRLVIAYLGKLGGMYMDRELFAFFKHCLRRDHDRCFFFLFTDEPGERISAWLHEFDIPSETIHFRFLAKSEVPGYLSAADVAFCGIRPIASRRFSSPIKNGEYWACGLPVLIPKGISDDYLYASEENIGFAFEDVEEITLEVLNNLARISRSTIERKAYTLRGLGNFEASILRLLKQ